jgi:hypothetical protein
MAKRYLPILVLAFVGCHAYWSKVLKGTPDIQLTDGPAVYLHGIDAGRFLPIQLEIVHQRALAICPEKNRASLESLWGQILIDWEPTQRFADGKTGFVGDCLREVNGCQPLPYWIEVDEVIALPDELGHIVFEACFGDTGEQTLSDAGILYSNSFAVWTDETRAALLTLDP